MTPERWRQIEALFHAALDCGGDERARILEQSDPDLRQEVESLLAQNGSLPSPAEFEWTETPIAPGMQLGPYRVEALLGEGGMGQVFRATDTRLGRAVALKTSHERLDPRFEREARAISALNHPHICTLHDVGPNYFVMELCEGETLATRLKRGKLSLDETIRYGIQIAEALAEAHAKQIIHRDLKPGNIVLTKTGVKLLDFGLARILSQPRETGANETQTASFQGAVVGTAPYMAPEQIEGQPCDARTDIFALGLILFEMAAGRRAFHGDSQARLMAAILKEEAPPLNLETVGSPRFEELVRGCLAKAPSERWQSAQDVRKVLALVDGRPAEVPKQGRSRWLAIGLAALAVTLAPVLALWLRRPAGPPDSALVQFSIAAPDGVRFATAGTGPPYVAVSPDGRQIAFLARTQDNETSYIWLRKLDSVAPQRLDGAQATAQPFWSPDGRFLAFPSGGKLQKADIATGGIQAICDIPVPFRGGSWGPDGTIVFSAAHVLQRVSASGGVAVAITRLNEADGETIHAWPQFLPDGKSILYLARNKDATKSAIYLQPVGSDARKKLLATRFMALATAPGHLLFVRDDGTLMRQSFNLGTHEVREEPVALGAITAYEGTVASVGGGYAGLTVSTTGVLVYQQAAPLPRSRFVWRDAAGQQFGVLGDEGAYNQMALSPDEKWLAVNPFTRNQRPDLWLFELTSGAFSRLTINSSEGEQDPMWSPDSTRILTNNSTNVDCLIHEITPASRLRRLIYSSPGDPCWLGDWSKDGTTVVYHSFAVRTHKVYLLPLTVDAKPRLAATGDYVMDEFHFSPDGKWLAFNSNETGRFEVYVASIPSFAIKRQVSIAGGVQPVWRSDGKALYFLSLDGKMMRTEIRTDSSLTAEVPKTLFQTQLPTGSQNTTYAVTRDGRFILREPTGPSASRPLTVVVNWAEPFQR